MIHLEFIFASNVSVHECSDGGLPGTTMAGPSWGYGAFSRSLRIDRENEPGVHASHSEA